MARKPSKRSRVPRKTKMMRKMRLNGVPDIASLTEMTTVVVNSSNSAATPATGFNQMTLAYSPFTRAQAVAAQYQYYRIKRVTYTVKPTFDTYAPGGPTTVPYVYWSINKTGENLQLPLVSLQHRGAKPIRLDDKNVVISYAPTVGVQNVLTSDIANNAGSFKTSPWLTTDAQQNLTSWTPSTVQHYGHYMLITQGGVQQYDVVVQVEFQFKKPRSPVATNVGDPIKDVFDESIEVQ